MASTDSERTLLFVLGSVMALGIGIVFWQRCAPHPSPSPSAATTNAAGTPAAPNTPKSKPKSVTDPVFSDGYATTYESPIDIANPREVDVASLVPKARAFALKLQPKAQLVEIRGSGLERGVANVEGPSRLLISFEFLGVDPTKPVGKDVIKKTIGVEVKPQKLVAVVVDGRAMSLDHPSESQIAVGVMPDPGCTSTDAWATAVASGVPSATIATLVYDDNVMSVTPPVVWIVLVDDHPELYRRIDGLSCALVSK